MSQLADVRVSFSAIERHRIESLRKYFQKLSIVDLIPERKSIF